MTTGGSGTTPLSAYSVCSESFDLEVGVGVGGFPNTNLIIIMRRMTMRTSLMTLLTLATPRMPPYNHSKDGG